MDNQDFLKFMLDDLSPNDKDITLFCLQTLSQFKNLNMHFMDRYIQYCHLKNKSDLQYYHAPVFTGLVRIINPVNKNDIAIREVYLDSMIQDCLERKVRKLLVKGNEFEKSLLLKFIHEKNYELTTISQIKKIISRTPRFKSLPQPINKRKFHLVKVRHQPESKQKKLFLQQVSSLIFEEIALQAMREKVPHKKIKLLGTINIPKNGDLLLSLGEDKYTVEVKCNERALNQIEKSTCLYGIHSITPSSTRSIPSGGCVVGCRLLFRKNLKSQFQPKDISFKMSSQLCKSINSSLKKILPLSRIYVPDNLDLSFQTLMVGNSNQKPGVPILGESFIFQEESLSESWNSNSRNQNNRWSSQNNYTRKWNKNNSTTISGRKKSKKKSKKSK